MADGEDRVDGADQVHGEDQVPDPGYQDVTCSFCDRHNRDVHLVAGRDGLTICQVCIARCAQILDVDAGVVGPEVDWPARWPTKTPISS